MSGVMVLFSRLRTGLLILLLLGFSIPLSWSRSDMPEKTEYTNRLAQEKSPYLLQHADNPVDWYPWGAEAFDKSKREDKPIFLSIGYSTCHWCHVMAHESFEDAGVAELMNEHFVSIKVDREERPDVDQLYMAAVTRMTGQGGWPLTVFLTPDLKPFFGGTYFPPEDRWGRPGLKSVLNGIAKNWKEKRQEMVQAGEKMVEILQAETGAATPGTISEALLGQAAGQYAQSFDATHGGFGSAPKFPRAHSLSFLLRHWKRAEDPQALQIVEKTLQAMANGGMWDHVGDGFHRYSTDERWHVPHFEKMLYDQAILAKSYLETYQATDNPIYADQARKIFTYLLRELRDPAGGFHSAEDADSIIDPNHPEEKGEGAFYVWTADELKALLGEDAAIFGFLYGVEPGGNALEDPMQEFQGRNILFAAQSISAAAKQFGRSEEAISTLVENAKQTLFEVRAKRPKPHLDDKVLVDWNGLTISALAFGSRVLNEPAYRTAAVEAADFILEQMVNADGRLLHRYREGEAGIPGTLEDYAFFIHGLIDLYEATFEVRYLAEAKRLTEQMLILFWDERQGGFFMVGTDAEQLLVRQKEIYDGAIPSGNSMAALDLLRIGRLTANEAFEEKAQQLFEAFAGQIQANPFAYPQLLIALDFAAGPSKEIVLAGDPDAAQSRQMLEALYSRFLPNKVVVTGI